MRCTVEGTLAVVLPGWGNYMYGGSLCFGDSGIGDNPKLFLKNFMAPFYGWGSTAKAAKPLRGESLLFTTTFSGIPGTHLTNLGMMKG